MPKYYQNKICGYYLYFTSFCTVECMHVHASNRKLTEEGSAKFFVKEDGSTILQKRGILNDREISKIQEYIKRHYKEMYIKWKKGNNVTAESQWNNINFKEAIFTLEDVK